MPSSAFQKIFKAAKFVRRNGGVKTVARLAANAPKYANLYKRLLSDRRVPVVAKTALLGAAGYVVSPWNIPNYIPIIGALDDMAIMTIAHGFFINQVPDYILKEHRKVVGLTDDDL